MIHRAVHWTLFTALLMLQIHALAHNSHSESSHHPCVVCEVQSHLHSEVASSIELTLTPPLKSETFEPEQVFLTPSLKEVREARGPPV